LPPAWVQVSGVQPGPGKQTPAVQIWPLGQAPQARVPPQPSPTLPQ
jgi:hypothetical protein